MISVVDNPGYDEQVLLDGLVKEFIVCNFDRKESNSCLLLVGDCKTTLKSGIELVIKNELKHGFFRTDTVGCVKTLDEFLIAMDKFSDFNPKYIFIHNPQGVGIQHNDLRVLGENLNACSISYNTILESNTKEFDKVLLDTFLKRKEK